MRPVAESRGRRTSARPTTICGGESEIQYMLVLMAMPACLEAGKPKGRLHYSSQLARASDEGNFATPGGPCNELNCMGLPIVARCLIRELLGCDVRCAPRLDEIPIEKRTCGRPN